MKQWLDIIIWAIFYALVFIFCLKMLSKVIERMIMNEDLSTYKETLMGHLKHDTPVNKPHLFSLIQVNLINLCSHHM